MRVLFAASELTPIAKVGGLGDVIGALPKAEAKLGVEAEVVIPFYEVVRSGNWKPERMFSLDERTAVWRTFIPNSTIPVYLIENDEFLSQGPVYFEKTAFVGTQKEIDRFTFFSKTVATLIDRGFFKPDIVHANDWHTGALVSMLEGKKVNTIFTIHNLANQGTAGGRNLMAEGIRGADFITTVSPTYAKEILTSEYGEGLDEILRSRQKNLKGILNGIDYEFWNPAEDAFLFKQYTKETVREGKAENKKAVLQSFGLEGGAPLFGLVARLTSQKGIDFITDSIPLFFEKYDARFVCLGQGAPIYETALKRLAERFPDRVQVRFGFNEELAHRIYAGSDFFLMPSRFEPCGLGQMIAMRYGTIPIVRSTGGLKDSVKQRKTGFVFKAASAKSFRSGLQTAMHVYEQNISNFETMRIRAMEENFDFEVSAKAYIKLYRTLLE
ncbi:MAG: glycogen synthase [Patescibacteria group bacterium]